ncbi:MAG: glycerol-3-phosphate acyltransferase, partial [Gemmataceae bacterium]
ATAAISAWAIVTLSTRYVSLGSILAVLILLAVHLGLTHSPLDTTPATVAYLVVGGLFVIFKHRANIARLWNGTENQVGDFPRRESLIGGLHLLALGFWFGGAGFFNFVAAPTIFSAFENVVSSSPSDRTALVPIVPPGTSELQQKNLASALAGSAVGPIFPKYFTMQLLCGGVAWLSTLGATTNRRPRFVAVTVGLICVLIGASLGPTVSRLRHERYSADLEVATTAKKLFGPIHLVSLAASGVGVLAAGAALALAAKSSPKPVVAD